MNIIQLNISLNDFKWLERACEHYDCSMSEACEQIVRDLLRHERAVSDAVDKAIKGGQTARLGKAEANYAESEKLDANKTIEMHFSDKQLVELEKAAEWRHISIESLLDNAVNDYICELMDKTLFLKAHAG